METFEPTTSHLTAKERKKARQKQRQALHLLADSFDLATIHVVPGTVSSANGLTPRGRSPPRAPFVTHV